MRDLLYIVGEGLSFAKKREGVEMRAFREWKSSLFPFPPYGCYTCHSSCGFPQMSSSLFCLGIDMGKLTSRKYMMFSKHDMILKLHVSRIATIVQKGLYWSPYWARYGLIRSSITLSRSCVKPVTMWLLEREIAERQTGQCVISFPVKHQ